ncbi:hypothetical protein P153DRAFT_228860 [Dothidotthia symphoricarpi CBS 119687]|uniref:Uncharacterized protein n=1 Tax=Dothidotthia symphoricarpi CBS 119687 TaxID=1392245 RepID=A0A6A6ADM6_9PLEO|nr:uncharacterized protein P153DRAFT_228860 [Dothidotthia symphoricarpi CBS 119687]KAF2129992.1 hypothetical protein P153DRAFT_228860 [Dothidotthia symphoricarpi CBS 119687]
MLQSKPLECLRYRSNKSRGNRQCWHRVIGVYRQPWRSSVRSMIILISTAPFVLRLKKAARAYWCAQGSEIGSIGRSYSRRHVNQSKVL